MKENKRKYTCCHSAYDPQDQRKFRASRRFGIRLISRRRSYIAGNLLVRLCWNILGLHGNGLRNDHQLLGNCRVLSIYGIGRIYRCYLDRLKLRRNRHFNLCSAVLAKTGIIKNIATALFADHKSSPFGNNAKSSEIINY